MIIEYIVFINLKTVIWVGTLDFVCCNAFISLQQRYYNVVSNNLVAIQFYSY